MEIKLGPLGDYSYGKKWEETGYDSISHIFVTYDNYGVNSIQFGYVENGALVFSKKHGSEGEDDSTRIVRLKHESEFITGISGEKWMSRISSLTFHTNERKHVAFQAEIDSLRETRPRTIEFHSGIYDRREFGGFFGSFSHYGLNSIGQSHGNKWDEQGRNVISHIFVYFDETSVISLSFGFIEHGKLVISKPYGLSDTYSCSVRIVRLNHETEFVTGLSGEWSDDFITSLTFHTNEKVHEAFRSNSVSEDEVNRREFYSGIHDRCEFGGFFGTFNVSRLLSIGFYTKPLLQGVNTMRREVWPF